MESNTPTIDEKKTQLEAAYKRNEKLENQAAHLKEIIDKLRAATHCAEDYSIEYGEEEVNKEDCSPPLRLFNKLDDILFQTKKEAEALDKVWDEHETALYDLKSEEGVVCRCCGEIRCEDPDRAKTAPLIALHLLRVKEREGSFAKYGPIHIYQASFTYENLTTLQIEGTNGVIGQAAKEFWVKHGFDEYGAYHYSLALEHRLKQALAKATART